MRRRKLRGPVAVPARGVWGSLVVGVVEKAAMAAPAATEEAMKVAVSVVVREEETQVGG